MSNVVYLKKEDSELMAYNTSNMTSIRLYKNECEFKTYEDNKDISWHIGHDLQNESFFTNKSEFDQALNKFEATLKEIKDALNSTNY